MAKLLKKFVWMLCGGGILLRGHCGGPLSSLQESSKGESLAGGGDEDGTEIAKDEIESEDDIEMVKPKRTNKSMNSGKNE